MALNSDEWVLKNKGLLTPDTESLLKEQVNNLDKIANYFKELNPRYLDLDPNATEQKIGRVIGLQSIGALSNYFDLFKGVGSIQAGGIASDIGKEILADAPMILLEKRLLDMFRPGKGEEFLRIMEPFKDVKFSKKDLKETVKGSATDAMKAFEDMLLTYFGLPLTVVPSVTSIREGIVAPVTDKIVPTGVSQEKKEIEKRKETRKLNIPIPIPKRKPSEEKVSQLNISSRPSITAPPAQNVAQANLGPFNPETLARMEQLDRLIG